VTAPRWLLAATATAALACGARTAPGTAPPLHRTGLAQTHLATCDDAGCGDGQEPPLGGPHCAIVSPCRVWTAPVPRCQWLHNLEHGHAVLAYNCPTGCPDVVAALTAFFDGGRGRVLVTPDPKLTTRVAALVWGWGWAGDTADADAIRAVLAYQDVDAPEAGLGCPP